MKRGTQIRRKLLAIRSQGKTRRGNPEGYWVFLECGHVNWKWFTAGTSIDIFMFTKGQPIDMLCRNCSGGKTRINVINRDIEMCDGTFPPKIRLLQRQIKEYRDSLKSLAESAPGEFERDFKDVSAYKYRHLKIVKEYRSIGDGWEEFKDNPWPGSHKHVYVWWVLEDGHAVGWNENPSRGWSFPVIKLKEED